jgi:hypothetical protein
LESGREWITGMDDLISTVTCEPGISYPGSGYRPAIKDTGGAAQQHVGAVNAATGVVSEIKVPEGTDAEIYAVLALTGET